MERSEAEVGQAGRAGRSERGQEGLGTLLKKQLGLSLKPHSTGNREQ